MLIRFIPSSKEKAELSQGSEISAPDFGNYEDRAYKENNGAPVSSYEPVGVMDSSMEYAYQTYQSSQQTSTSVQETTTASRNAPIHQVFRG